MDAANTSMLLLLLAAVGAIAEPSPGNCDGLNVTLHNADLHKILGDWVLVWAVADNARGGALFGHVISSHVELRLLPDNHTVTFSQRTLIPGNNCTNYFNNMSMPAEDSDDHTLLITAAMIEHKGKFIEYNESGEMDFFQTCNDSLSLVYKNPHGRHLMNYKREGHHQDVDKLKEHHDNHRKQAECLGFPHENPFSYDGAADFCHKKSAPEPEVEPTADVKPAAS